MNACEMGDRPIGELTPHEVGAIGEQIAATFVEKTLGFKVIERNWHSAYGEADVIATDDSTLYFVEVKPRVWSGERELIYPEIAVDEAKLKRYENIIAAYLQRYVNPPRAQFDVAAVVIDRPHHAALHYKPNVSLRDEL